MANQMMIQRSLMDKIFEAESKVIRELADNYRYYTGRIWGLASNFDIALNTDMGINYVENCIRQGIE